MKNANNHDERIGKMTFASVYPSYLAKVEKKGRTKEELHQVIEWLTGFNEQKLQELIDEKVSFEVFFQRATLNLSAHLITGINLWLSSGRNRKSSNPTGKVFGQVGG